MSAEAIRPDGTAIVIAAHGEPCAPRRYERFENPPVSYDLMECVAAVDLSPDLSTLAETWVPLHWLNPDDL